MPSSAAADGVPEQLDTSVRVVNPNAPGGGPLKVDAPG